MASNLIERLMKRTQIIDGHWIWMGSTSGRSGHGQARIDGKLRLIHRYIFCLENNLDINNLELFICHKIECNIPRCWNPEHLYSGSVKDNNTDRAKTTTHCKQGHPYTSGSIIYRKDGTREKRCNICRRERNK